MLRAVAFVTCLSACGRLDFDPRDADRGDLHEGGTQVVHATGPGIERLQDLAIDDSGSLALTGTFESMVQIGGRTATSIASNGEDMLVTVIDLDGSARWLYASGASTIGIGHDVTWLPDGSLLAGGYFSGTLLDPSGVSSGSGQDALRLHFAADGQRLAARVFGGTQNVQLRGLAATATRSIMGGVYGGSVDFGDGVLPSSASDSGFLVVSDAAGEGVSSRGLAGASDVYVNDVAIAADGSFCAGGRFAGTTDFGGGPIAPVGPAASAWVAKYEADGSLRWIATLGAPAGTGGIAVASNGDCIASGEFLGTIAIDGHTATAVGAEDGWFARFDVTTGAAAWLTSFGGAGSDLAYGVATYPPDGVVLAGRFSGSADLGGLAVTSEGSSDAFIAGYDGASRRQWLQLLQGEGTVDGRTLGRVATDPSGTRAGVAFDFTGTLRVGEDSWTADSTDGATVVVSIPR